MPVSSLSNCIDKYDLEKFQRCLKLSAGKRFFSGPTIRILFSNGLRARMLGEFHVRE